VAPDRGPRRRSWHYSTRSRSGPVRSPRRATSRVGPSGRSSSVSARGRRMTELLPHSPSSSCPPGLRSSVPWWCGGEPAVDLTQMRKAPSAGGLRWNWKLRRLDIPLLPCLVRQQRRLMSQARDPRLGSLRCHDQRSRVTRKSARLLAAPLPRSSGHEWIRPPRSQGSHPTPGAAHLSLLVAGADVQYVDRCTLSWCADHN